MKKSFILITFIIALMICVDYGSTRRYMNINRFFWRNHTRTPLKDIVAEATKSGFWDKINPVKLWNKIPFDEVGSSVSKAWNKIFKRSANSPIEWTG
ncbi:hypothetical protein WA026_014396 [Henosepilachna vigintioctopunctata]|uniref:Uncharacterized protein n=1 Tax=Henosepilachna vigintioctopunctata TaxID=420089 RepID=A0AAW1UBG1_9CUCU